MSKLESIRDIALKFIADEGLPAPTLSKAIFKIAPHRPLGKGLFCWYCGVELYFVQPRPEWKCDVCEGSGSTKDGECYRCYGTGASRVWTPERRPNSYSQDHVIPRSRGGSNRRDNLVDCCQSCNSRKRDRTLEEYRYYLSIQNPLGKLHDELAQWEISDQLDESDRAVIAECRSRLKPPPPITFYGEIER
jgi:hypothetical protein